MTLYRYVKPNQRPNIVTGLVPDPRPPKAIVDEFRQRLAAGVRLVVDGSSKNESNVWERPHYQPHNKIELFGAEFYVSDFLFDDWINFVIAYVVVPDQPRRIYVRVFYKDSSLVWRVVSHVVSNEQEHWIGKGDVVVLRHADGDLMSTAEESTNLPYEIHAALDDISRRRKRRRDREAVVRFARNGPSSRMAPYADFSRPRDDARRVNGGRQVARIKRRGAPRSLWFARGFEPDLKDGLVEVTTSSSRLYGGDVRKHRILSANREIQYQFLAAPKQVWMNPPQVVSTELITYGIRARHVHIDDEAFVPGYEFHYLDASTDPPQLVSQIPDGFVGEVCPVDDTRYDASPWLDQLYAYGGHIPSRLTMRRSA